MGQVSAAGAKAYETDHLGSVINTETAGTARAFGQWGENLSAAPAVSLSSDPASYGFAGRSLDLESGFYYSRARTYDPSTGRFLQPDPIFPRSGTNPYTYAWNNPVLVNDPTGLWCPSPTNLANRRLTFGPTIGDMFQTDQVVLMYLIEDYEDQQRALWPNPDWIPNSTPVPPTYPWENQPNSTPVEPPVAPVQPEESTPTTPNSSTPAPSPTTPPSSSTPNIDPNAPSPSTPTIGPAPENN